ncbi:hypothetical protein F3Y22_tig00000329pilonHSYRG00075 [Hibiscus syriacus]|uniref:Uncharacterized protein n=1 Tax=Hibiscus syriacus TaxID=106335 RepID=A0A6A3D584_HIBSY|nr:hypothetical protein F3Y22_tig00000329pilonHSYRG00075 [Hibiscus syriacus]
MAATQSNKPAWVDLVLIFSCFNSFFRQPLVIAIPLVEPLELTLKLVLEKVYSFFSYCRCEIAPVHHPWPSYKNIQESSFLANRTRNIHYPSLLFGSPQRDATSLNSIKERQISIFFPNSLTMSEVDSFSSMVDRPYLRTVSLVYSNHVPERSLAFLHSFHSSPLPLQGRPNLILDSYSLHPPTSFITASVPYGSDHRISPILPWFLPKGLGVTAISSLARSRVSATETTPFHPAAGPSD